MRKILKTIMIAWILLNLGIAGAQAPVYHNGDVIRISVTFDGPDAAKIEAAAFTAGMGVPAATSQAGFQTGFYCDQSKSKKTAPNTFECSFTIPDTQASGEYTLNQIRGFAHVGDQVQVFWDSPADFPKKMLRIENSNKFVKPSIKDVTIP
jgi:hypothetical protein